MSHRVPTNGRPSQSSTTKPAPVSGLYVKVRFNNTLPDIPFDPKFIVNPLSISKYVDYETTSLEQNAKHELLTPADMGVDIDLIPPERYAIPDNPILDPEDERLVNDDETLALGSKKNPRDKPHSQLHNKVVPWLKKTEYISTEYNRYGSSNEKTETKIGHNVRKSMKEDELFLDRESQIKAINRTFEAAQAPIEKHPTKPNVYAKQVMPLFPDYEMWKYLFAHVKFDSEPADSSEAERMSQAIIRGAYDEDLEESFVVYFLPTGVTMTDRLLDHENNLEYTEGKEYEYLSRREYTWSANHINHGDDFFFAFRGDEVYYNRLSMEVTLKKRRNKSHNEISTLVVKNRPVNDEEISGQEEKLKQLEKPSPSQEADLTAQSLERSYEEMNQTNRTERSDVSLGVTQADIASPDEAAEQSSSSSSPASSSGESEGSSEASSSSSAEESNDDDNDDDEED